MPSGERDELAQAIGTTIMRWQDATEAFDAEVGRIYGLNSADRRCLELVSQAPQTASAIARETMLTSAAVTALIDRLEGRGMVRRRNDTRDRRKVFVEATDKTRALIRDTYLPTVRAGERLLARYTVEELTVIHRFLEEALALQRRMTARLLERAVNRNRDR